MSKFNGPSVWKRLSNLLSPVYDNQLLIAGGSPRDWVVNKQIRPKDIDIFVPVESEFDLELTIPDINDLGQFDDVHLMQGPSSYVNMSGQNNPDIVGVLSCSFNGYLPINVIGKREEAIADPLVLMSDFDHSLCRIWVDPKTFEPVLTEEAQKTLDTGEILLYNQDKEVKGATVRRIERMLSKGKSYDRFTYEGKDEAKFSDAKLDVDFSIADYQAAHDQARVFVNHLRPIWRERGVQL
jgi:hypothetical protein